MIVRHAIREPIIQIFPLIVLPVIRRITMQQQIRITFQQIYQQTVQNAILLNRDGVLQNSISMMGNIFRYIQENMQGRYKHNHQLHHVHRPYPPGCDRGK